MEEKPMVKNNELVRVTTVHLEAEDIKAIDAELEYLTGLGNCAIRASTRAAIQRLIRRGATLPPDAVAA
jgi:hypothetical protein